jgi:hypothetical protein
MHSRPPRGAPQGPLGPDISPEEPAGFDPETGGLADDDDAPDA